MCEDGEISFKKVLQMLGTEDEHLLSHAIWKLSAFSRFVQVSLNPEKNVARFLSLRQIIYTAAVLQKRERKSFYYRVKDMELKISMHFVGLVAHIAHNDEGSEVWISDGIGIRKAMVRGNSEADKALQNLVLKGKMFVGQKLHLINQGSTGGDDGEEGILLNYNGIYPA